VKIGTISRAMGGQRLTHIVDVGNYLEEKEWGGISICKLYLVFECDFLELAEKNEMVESFMDGFNLKHQ